MANNREISQFASFLTVDESANNNVGIATTVRISAGGLYVDGVEVIGPGGSWRGPNSGLVGAQGAQGAPGAQGAQGSQGVQGASGPTAQIAKAWVNFNGQSTVAIRDDYNVNSITDLGTAEYRINWSTSFANANYCVVTGNSIQADSSTMSLYNNRWSGSSIEPNYTGYIECSARESSANQVKDIDYGYLVAYDN